MCMQGKVTISDTTDPATDKWQKRNYLNYTDIVTPGSRVYESGFSGATCVTVTFDNNCSTPYLYWYLVEMSRFLPAFDDAGWSDPIQLSARTGLVNESICAGSCHNKRIRLDSALGYYVMIGYSSDGDDTCKHEYTMTTYTDSLGESGGWLITPSVQQHKGWYL